MPLLVARLPLVSLAVIALLPACASVSLNAPPPVPPAASTLPGDAERYPPPRPRDPPAAPVESPAVSLAQAPPVAPPTAATPQPLPPPSEIAVAPTSAPAPIAASAAGSAARPPAPVAAAPVAPAPVAPAASAAPALAAGPWSVQVGVFAVARNAENARARTAERLADAGIAGTSVRTVERDGRTYVVVGALPDRAGAQQLAARLRTVLQQDVVLFRW
jgi:cell division protein FtsN